MRIYIKKFKNGNINIKLDRQGKMPHYIQVEQVIYDNDVQMNDLYFIPDLNGGLMLIDYNKGLIYDIASYFNASTWRQYDFFHKLLTDCTIKLYPYDTLENAVKDGIISEEYI